MLQYMSIVLSPGSGRLGLNPGSATHWLCDPRQAVVCKMRLVILHRVGGGNIKAVSIWLKAQTFEAVVTSPTLAN